MKLGIDSYCYHRYYGEVYPWQEKPEKRWDVFDFLRRAKELGVDGVSIESCFLPIDDKRFMAKLKEALDEYGFERVWAWGHPEGLKTGLDPEAPNDLKRNLAIAKELGAKVMRIVGGSGRTRDAEEHSAQVKRLIPILKDCCKAAEEQGVVIAQENHADFTADEMLEILHGVDSRWLGVTFDSGNCLRVFDDPVEAARKLAPYVRATHIKDIKPTGKGSPYEFTFWASAPLGQGIVDIAQICRVLLDAGYDGLICVEVDYLKEEFGDEDKAVEKSIAYLRSLP